MKLSQLLVPFPGLTPPAGDGPEVTGVACDSQRVEPGDLFVAIPGERFDGRRFAAAAAARGAVAVLGPRPEAGPPPELPVPWVDAPDPRRLLGPLAARAYGQPDRELALIGVTGTNGKSTVVALAAAMLNAAGMPSGTLGTLGYRLGARSFEGDRTTPEAADFYRILRRMRDEGARGVAMEVSSHALALGRVSGALYRVAAFTNLTRDHLDYHRSLEAYFAAKRRLFDQLAPEGRAVVNVDDPYGRRLAAELPAAVTYGGGGEVSIFEAELEGSGSRGVVATPRGHLAFRTPLLGRYNLENVLAAVAVGEALGLPHGAVAQALAGTRPLPGRLEPVTAGQPFPAYVDYAHTPGALEAVLRSVRDLWPGRRVIVVFGCGGDRDTGKRDLMGRAAGLLAEIPILTSDNPRSEDPLAIIAAVRAGLEESGNRSFRVEPDRAAAIRLAVSLGGPDAVLVVAGKGHEEVQIVGAEVRPFSDREEIARAAEERFGSVAHG